MFEIIFCRVAWFEFGLRGVILIREQEVETRSHIIAIQIPDMSVFPDSDLSVLIVFIYEWWLIIFSGMITEQKEPASTTKTFVVISRFLRQPQL